MFYFCSFGGIDQERPTRRSRSASSVTISLSTCLCQQILSTGFSGINGLALRSEPRMVAEKMYYTLRLRQHSPAPPLWRFETGTTRTRPWRSQGRSLSGSGRRVRHHPDQSPVSACRPCRADETHHLVMTDGPYPCTASLRGLGEETAQRRRTSRITGRPLAFHQG